MSEPKNNIMTPMEMQEMQSRSGRLYSRAVDGAEVVSELTEQLAYELANVPRKIDLRDSELITKVAVSYVVACSKKGTVPNKLGLCRAMGCSRQSVDYYLSHHAEEKSAELLRIIFDSFAEMLTSSALANAVHPIVSIFVTKAIYSWREAVKVEAEQPVADPLGERRNVSEIIAKYEGLLPD